MMNAYTRVMEFVIDGKVVRDYSWTILADDKEAKTEVTIDGCGRTFDSLWEYCGQPGKCLNVPCNRWESALWSKKRRIEFFPNIKTWIDNGTEREWEVRYIDVLDTISMDALLQKDADKVIQYFKDRGLTACPLMK